MSSLKHIEFVAGGRRWCADLSRPLNIAIALAFDGAQPSFYGAQPATAVPLHSGSFVGDVLKGGSCRCSTYTLTPHCNGTHTESVGHVVHEPVSIHATASEAFLVARVVSVAPSAVEEGTAEPAVPGDRIITAAQLQSALKSDATVGCRALVVRTLPNAADKTTRTYALDAGMPPYFSTDALRWIVAQGVDHLVVDLPSIDRAVDGGLLRGHRIFWGLPEGSTQLAHATRPHATITELAYIDNAIADGPYLLNLQVPAFESDAAPSRPILYPIEPATS
ncbi:MAG: cyclase family protein [Steroidobacteraceae bacterium]